MRVARRLSVADLAVAALAGSLALAIYIRSMAPGLLWGDSAEFQFAAWLGGFAHPTGYPLYLILGWLWSHLAPLGEPAFRMNLFSGLWGAAAVALVSLAVMAALRFVDARATGGAARLVALGVPLVFALTPTLWSQAVIAEVYTLHAALLAALLLALLTWAKRLADPDSSGTGRLGPVIALLFGLSLAHHRSTILLLPAAALFAAIVLRGAVPRPRFDLRRAAVLTACVLAPLLLYLVIPLRAPHVPYYRIALASGQSLALYDATLTGFLAHITGSVFSTSLVAAFDLSRLAGRFADELAPNGLLLGAIGLVWLLERGIRRRDRRAWALLALSGTFFLTQVAFNSFYAIGDIHVFYIPAYLVWMLWLACGAWWLVRVVSWLIPSPGEGRRSAAQAAGGILAFVVLAAFAYRSAVVFWPKVHRASDNSAQVAWDALLAAALPRDAILVSNDRDEIAPLFYLQYVKGQGPDLTGLFPRLREGPEWETVTHVTDLALATGRPVYLVKPMPGLELKYDLSPVGSVRAGGLGPPFTVRPRAMVAPDFAGGPAFGGKVRLAGYDVDPRQPSADRPLRVVLYWEPLQPMGADWTTFVQIVDANGSKQGQSDHRPGGDFYPSSLWNPGERLADTHTITLVEALGPGPYRLIAGLYVSSGGQLQHLGEPQTIGELDSPD